MIDPDPSEDQDPDENSERTDTTDTTEQSSGTSNEEQEEKIDDGETGNSKTGETVPIDPEPQNESTETQSGRQGTKNLEDSEGESAVSSEDRAENGTVSTNESDASTNSEPHSSQEPEKESKSVARLEERIETLEETVEESQQRIDDLESLLSDYQRRNEHEHEEIKNYAIEDFARDMLDIKDNLQDAIELEDLQEGPERRLQIITKQFDQVFTSEQIDKIEPALGEEYDNDLHRMIDKEATDSYDTEEIVRVVEIGYAISERVIRPAQVVVSE
ncbi:nucleotide exchange factor GrpE [Natranaeroarchaeum sulfidigenes]|uniref:Protein GrpE n=1 Tax=Natranaeroarchaeum sulfidigenes TaxID=2784880 RepID=A0A897MR82_9EURY|nr:nucleotide exchange factor GrpE [Natranaeroarchaeum sulfidigenes]QSG02932.1 Molecular chaperone GrpE (heat shock protein) [Natranaeroarchaeum sulfidigenes]